MHAITDKEKPEEAATEEICCTEEQKKVLRGGYRFSTRARNKPLSRSNDRKQTAKNRNGQDKIIFLGGVDQNMIEFVFLMWQCLVRKCKNTGLPSV